MKFNEYLKLVISYHSNLYNQLELDLKYIKSQYNREVSIQKCKLRRKNSSKENITIVKYTKPAEKITEKPVSTIERFNNSHSFKIEKYFCVIAGKVKVLIKDSKITYNKGIILLSNSIREAIPGIIQAI
jgi:hypothetical protein